MSVKNPRDAVIIAASRTAIGTARRGALVNVSAPDLAQTVLTATVERSGLRPELFDDFLLGEVYQGGGDIARYVAVESGLVHLPGVALNRQCATGLTAIAQAVGSIRAGMDSAVLAGGVESASTSPLSRRRKLGTTGKSPQDWEDPWFSFSHPHTESAPAMDMSITVGWNCAVDYSISRERQDEWALRSHERALDAIDSGKFLEEIVPVKVSTADGIAEFTVDEHPRRGSSMDSLGALKVLHPEIEGFSVTAGNSSGLNDAAAIVAVLSRELAERESIEPLATVRSWASTGVAPEKTGMAPTIAIPRALERAGLSISDVTLIEINEAFAAQVIACVDILGLDEDIVNVYGSGISLGHPIAATGARMATSMTYELRRRGGGIGVIAMCAGGGMGSAMVLEV